MDPEYKTWLLEHFSNFKSLTKLLEDARDDHEQVCEALWTVMNILLIPFQLEHKRIVDIQPAHTEELRQAIEERFAN